MRRQKIAVIGGGGAGATAAWALRNTHDVTLFEAEDTLGGHALSPLQWVNGEQVPIDMGVEFFTEKTSPNLMALLDHFRLPTFVAPLSCAASFEKGLFWSNTQDQGPLWPLLREECSRWHRDMHEVMHGMDSSLKRLTLGEFLAQKGYSSDFFKKALRPLLTTFSSCHAPLQDYSLTFAAFSFNLGLLSFFQPSYWRKAKGGIGAYLSCVQEILGMRVRLGTPVERVTPAGHQVAVRSQGQEELFDSVVFAVHGDQALKLLSTPTKEQREILSAFHYTSITSVLHQDPLIRDAFPCPHSYIQFHGVGSAGEGDLTRILGHLDGHRHLKAPLLVTFDAKREIAPETIITQKRWKIPLLRPQDMVTKKRMRKLQGQGNMWFCGTDTSFTGHEGAVLSGLVIAERLGAPYPFASNPWAKLQLDLAKGLMGVYPPCEVVSQRGGDLLFKASKMLGLHTSQMPRVLLDLYA
jgi:predicted NAD/FAD-binding protein